MLEYATPASKRLVVKELCYARTLGPRCQCATHVRFCLQPTKSPMLSLISESIEGALVIRAFGPKQKRRFLRQHHCNVDTNIEAIFASQVVAQWFSMRVQLTSAALLFIILMLLEFN